MEELLRMLISPLVEHPDAIQIEEAEGSAASRFHYGFIRTIWAESLAKAGNALRPSAPL